MDRDADGVRAARTALRMRSHDLAAVAGLKPPQMSRIEHGKTPVPVYVDMLLALFERDESAIRFAIERAAAKQAARDAKGKRKRKRPPKPKSSSPEALPQ